MTKPKASDVKPFVHESLVRFSEDGSQWDLDLAKIPERKHAILAGVLREAATQLTGREKLGETTTIRRPRKPKRR